MLANLEVATTKPQIAIEEIDRIEAAGVRFGCNPGDAGYGMSAPVGRALIEREFSSAAGVPSLQKVYALP